MPMSFSALRNVGFVIQTIHKLYIKPYIEPYTASVSNPTQRAFKNLHWGVQKPTQNPARNLMLKFEKPFPLGRGWGRLPPKKTNKFERFFSDSTLTFLTSENTFRLPILPIRRIVFLCLPQIFLCLPLVFLSLPQIFLCLPLNSCSKNVGFNVGFV